MTATNHPIYFISEATGLLAQQLGNALFHQFPDKCFYTTTIPFITNEKKAQQASENILQTHLSQLYTEKPIILSTLLRPELSSYFQRKEFHYINIFNHFLPIFEEIFETTAVRLNRSQRTQDDNTLANRVDAIHFAITHDDGANPDDYDEAELIIIGISRSGKTPVAMFLATQMGIKTANYPLIEPNMKKGLLPEKIIRNQEKIIALTVSAKTLHKFRTRRFPHSYYAELETCKKEISLAKKIYEKYKIPSLLSSGVSIEETAIQVVHTLSLKDKKL